VDAGVTWYFWLGVILVGLVAGATFTLVQWVALYGQSIHV
jgi:hypothetical protein